MSYSCLKAGKFRDHALEYRVGCPGDMFNGVFQVPHPSGVMLNVIASNGEGWEHVSVTINGDSTATPDWEHMCYIKELFWEDEDTVVQYHPPKSEYVNCHPGCLHLWRPTGGPMPIPRPPPALGGGG